MARDSNHLAVRFPVPSEVCATPVRRLVLYLYSEVNSPAPHDKRDYPFRVPRGTGCGMTSPGRVKEIVQQVSDEYRNRDAPLSPATIFPYGLTSVSIPWMWMWWRVIDGSSSGSSEGTTTWWVLGHCLIRVIPIIYWSPTHWNIWRR